MPVQENATLNTFSSPFRGIFHFLEHVRLISVPHTTEDRNLMALLKHPASDHLELTLELLSNSSLLTSALKQENFNRIISHSNLEQVNTVIMFLLSDKSMDANSEQEYFDCVVNHNNLLEVTRVLAKRNTLAVKNRHVYTKLLLGAISPEQAIRALAILEMYGLTNSSWSSRIIKVLLSHSHPVDFINSFLSLLRGKLLDSTSAESYFQSIALHEKPLVIANVIRILDGIGVLMLPETYRLLTRHPNIEDLVQALQDPKVMYYLYQTSGQDVFEMLLKHSSPLLIVSIIQHLDEQLLTNYHAKTNIKVITRFKNPVLLKQMLVALKSANLPNNPDCSQACFDVITQNEYPKEMIDLISYLNISGLLQSLPSSNIRALDRNTNPWVAIHIFNKLLQLGFIPEQEKQKYFDLIIKYPDPDFILNTINLMNDIGLLSNGRGRENFDAIMNCIKAKEVVEALWRLRTSHVLLASETQKHFDALLIDENPIRYALLYIESEQVMIVPLSFNFLKIPENLQIIDDLYWNGALSHESSEDSDAHAEHDMFNGTQESIKDILGESSQSPLFEMNKVQNRRAVLKHRNATALAAAVDFLYQHGLLNQDNFNRLIKHEQIDDLVKGLSTLNNAHLMSSDWGLKLFKQVATHESPWHAAIALWEFSQFGLLSGTNVDAHIRTIGGLNPSDLRLLGDAVELLHQDNLLDDAALRLLSSSSNRYDLAQALVILNNHGLLAGYAAKANIQTVVSSLFPKEMASALGILYQRGILKGIKAPILRHKLSKHKSPYDLAIAWCKLEEYDLLTAENIELVNAHNNSLAAASTLATVYFVSAATDKADHFLKKAIRTKQNPAVITEAMRVFSDNGLSNEFSATLYQNAVLNHPDPVSLAKAFVAFLQSKPINELFQLQYLNAISTHPNPLFAATLLLLPCLAGHETQKHRHLKQINEHNNTLGAQTILNALDSVHLLSAEFLEHHFGLILKCKDADHLSVMITMLGKVQLFSSDNGRRNIVLLFQHENPLILFQALDRLNLLGLLSYKNAEEILISRCPQLLSQALTDLHKVGLLNEHNRNILVKHSQPLDASRVLIHLSNFGLLSLKMASSFEDAIAGHAALETVADNLARYDTEELNTNRMPNERYSLIIDLKKYIARTEFYQEGRPGTIDFEQGFLFFTKSRGANRQANYLLACHLLKVLLFSPEISVGNLYENVYAFRAEIIIENNIQHHSDRTIHSNELNAIIEKLRHLALQEISELNPLQTDIGVDFWMKKRYV